MSAPSRMTSSHYSLSRRDFLKLGGLGMISLLFPSIHNLERLFTRIGATQFPLVLDLPRLTPELQGRVVEDQIEIFEKPSFGSSRVMFHWKDSVLPITDVTIGDDEPPFNRVWYRVGSEGFAHSGVVQPVQTRTNPIISQVPEGGALAEVTVPFTDARWGPGKNELVAYRYYYETTHWVIQVVYDNQGEPWYTVLDDKWELIFYVPASHMYILPDEEFAPLSPEVPPPLKRIEVRLDPQVLIAYEMEKPVFMARVATGAKFRDGDFSTQPGRYLTFHKRSSRHMAAGNLAANGYDLPGVPWISYITESGISFHGTYWHNNFGRPRSHGCINLTPRAARWVYRWTQPFVPPNEQKSYQDFGTQVDVL